MKQTWGLMDRLSKANRLNRLRPGLGRGSQVLRGWKESGREGGGQRSMGGL